MPQDMTEPQPSRHGSVIRLKPGQADDYKRLHAAVWSTVQAMIAACHIRNYSIFLREPEMLLFSYYEYHGTDHAADMARMAANPETQRWWAICGPMQEPLESRQSGEWWAYTEEVFHQD